MSRQSPSPVEPTLEVSGRSGDPEPYPGMQLDRYELLEEVGRGGMGVVFRARDAKLEREVALKVVRPAARESLGAEAKAEARMLREAQAMAAISHPHVIPVYDVRRTSAGLCIAMEFVDGPTLRGWRTDQRRWPEVVEVFRQAGEGLIAAHEAGLCHRDFKPSNVLVGRDDAGEPRVRVVDFGLARVAGLPDSGGGLHETAWGSGTLTEQGSVVGTPSYMAPEQHRNEAVGPAADQYAFCVSLYWALYGELPYPSRGRSLAQVLAYKEQHALPSSPPKPSVPRWLHAAVLRGLSPRAADRFPTMRHLLARIAAGRTRRKALGWATVTAFGVATAAWVPAGEEVGTPCELALVQPAPWDEASRVAVRDALANIDAEDRWAELDASMTAYSQRWSGARERMCAAAPQAGRRVRDGLACLAGARRSVEGLVGLFSAPDAGLLRRTSDLVAALPLPETCLQEASARYPMPEDPERALEAASIEQELGRISVIMTGGRYAEALEAIRPVEARARALGHRPTLARLLMRKGQLGRLDGDYEASENALMEAHARALDGDDTLTAIDAATALTYLVGYRRGRFEDGVRWYRDAEASIVRAGMSDTAEAALLWDNWGSVLTAAGRFDQALAAHRKALAIRERVTPEDALGRAVSASNVAAVMVDLDRNREAAELFEDALEVRRAELGPEHPKTISTMGHLASVYDSLGKTDLARNMLEEVIGLQERALGPGHVSIATSATNLSAVLHRLREYDAALALQERALEIWRTAYGEDHARVAIGHNNVASTLRELGRTEEAVTYYERALAVAEVAMGSDHPTVGTFLDNLGDMMRLGKRYEEALAYDERALAVRTASLGENHRAVADSLADIALSYKAMQRHDASLDYQRRANAIYREKLGEEHPTFFVAQTNLANALAAAGELEEAETIHVETLAKRETRFGKGHYETAASHVNLADVLLEKGDPKAALPHFEAAVRIWSRELPPDDPKLAIAKAGQEACRRRLGSPT